MSSGGGVEAKSAAAAGAAWREVDPEAGGPVFVCPACWPRVAAYWRTREDVTLRELASRPEWARCGVCEPGCVC